MKMLDFHRISAFMAAVTLLLLSNSAALADESDAVAKLYKQGNFAKALQQADAYLAIKPKDAQMRFQKGLILTEQNKTADAISIFSSIAEEYPDLPEPYNNLAVLYASQGQYDKAKGALEAAIRTHPSYATAHENLGDVYAKMASQAYGKALQLDKSNAAAQTKLAMIKDLFTGRPKEIQTASSPSVSAAPAIDFPAMVTEKVPEKRGEKVVEKAEISTAGKTADAKSVPEAQPAVPDGSDEVIKTIEAWAQAWSDKDVAAYLAFYASNFRPQGGSSRAAWEKNRRERVGKPKSIQVAITNPKVNLTDTTHARVSFKQSYQSDSIKSNTTKTLEMVKTGEKWLIQQEQAGR
jgi:tetratricopeptide (TPR) repeat protein